MENENESKKGESLNLKYEILKTKLRLYKSKQKKCLQGLFYFIVIVNSPNYVWFFIFHFI